MHKPSCTEQTIFVLAFMNCGCLCCVTGEAGVLGEMELVRVALGTYHLPIMTKSTRTLEVGLLLQTKQEEFARIVN